MLNSVGNTHPRVSHVAASSVHESHAVAKANPESHTLQQEAHASDKVAQIRKAIDAGHYKVDLDKTAHKMAQDLLS